MSIFEEINAALKSGKEIADDVAMSFGINRGTSIAKQSKAATMQFPVIISRSINVDSAQSIVKALERQYATFVQMVIYLNPFIDLDKDDLTSYIKRMHQNNPVPMDLVESCCNVYSNEAFTVFTALCEGSNLQIVKSNKDQLFCVEDFLNPNTVNDLYKPESMTLPVAESTLEYYCKKNNIIYEAKHRPKKEPKGIRINDLSQLGDAYQQAYGKIQNGENPNGGKVGPTPNGKPGVVKPSNVNSNPKPTTDNGVVKTNTRKGKGPDIDTENKVTGGNPNKTPAADPKDNDLDPKTKLEREKLDYTKARDIINDENQSAKEKIKFQQELKKAEAEYRSKVAVKLADNDIKKCNELVPTTISVSLQVKSKDNFGGLTNFLLGIKGIMHPVNSDEIVSNLLDGYKSGNKFFNFIRWTSGEIKFVKDLLLNVDGIKEDVLRKHNGGSHWWTTLKRRKKLARLSNRIGGKNILPNASIVVSMEEIIELKEAYGVDLMNVQHAKRIMDRYFLLGFVVVDESQELCYFLFDGENSYQALAFSGLDRENSNKNDFKEIYKMINSGRI